MAAERSRWAPGASASEKSGGCSSAWPSERDPARHALSHLLLRRAHGTRLGELARGRVQPVPKQAATFCATWQLTGHCPDPAPTLLSSIHMRVVSCLQSLRPLRVRVVHYQRGVAQRVRVTSGPQRRGVSRADLTHLREQVPVPLLQGQDHDIRARDHNPPARNSRKECDTVETGPSPRATTTAHPASHPHFPTRLSRRPSGPWSR
jgi:hypothetical protein